MVPQQDKKEMVRKMFDDISPRYDFLNHFLSFGIDKGWRRKLVRRVQQTGPSQILDVATGTGDLAIALSSIQNVKITGLDISSQMLEIGIKKVSGTRLAQSISFQTGDAEHIPFPDCSFDAVTVAFGVRNFGDLSLGIREMKRVLKPGGMMFILEFSHPAGFPMKQLYGFYSRFFIPVAGRLISGNSNAYRYLPESVAAFPSGTSFLKVLQDEGLKDLTWTPLSAGIASIYQARK
jgi:demethylmenaquinone methyltransferase/2-methoxy-6-polyprenyl-1,4-benzoquinol methylase